MNKKLILIFFFRILLNFFLCIFFYKCIVFLIMWFLLVCYVFKSWIHTFLGIYFLMLMYDVKFNTKKKIILKFLVFILVILIFHLSYLIMIIK